MYDDRVVAGLTVAQKRRLAVTLAQVREAPVSEAPVS
jgi:hypothetical protein